MQRKPHKIITNDNSKQAKMLPNFAALDLGTNNCRLLIATGDRASLSSSSNLRVVDSFSRIVRLGDSITETGKLSQAAMERTIDALTICKRKMERYDLSGQRLVATEACRKAANTPDFIARVKRELDLDIEVINNEEEAKLAVIGCSSLLSHDAQKAIVFDIGGGSTEVIWIDVQKLMEKKLSSGGSFLDLDGVVIDWISVDSGVMNLADRFGGASFADVTYDDMVKFLKNKLTEFSERNRIAETIASEAVQMVSTSGTLTTLGAICLGLPKYDRTKIDGLSLPLADIRDTIDSIYHMRPSERFNNGCIGPERADFILSGCAVFDAISRLWPVDNISIADRGVREGIILSLMLGHG